PPSRGRGAVSMRAGGGGRSAGSGSYGLGRRSAALPFDETGHHVPRVAGDAGDDVRPRRVLEDQADEVQHREGAHHTPLVHELAVLAEDREIDPRQVVTEAGT